MNRSRRSLLAAACFTLALGLPFGHATRVGPSVGAVLLQPRLIQTAGRFFTRGDGTMEVLPGELHMELMPMVLPTHAYVAGAPPGRASGARLALVGLLLASLVAPRRRSPRFARRAALLGALLLGAAGLVAALPSSGAFATLLGLALLASVRARVPRACDRAGSP